MSQKTEVATLIRVDTQTGAKKPWAQLDLPPNVSLTGQRWTSEGWSGSFTYYGQEEFVLRERSRGTIECEWRPFNRVSRKPGDPVRKRTGKKRIDFALNEALRKFIHPEHEKRVVSGPESRGEAEDDGRPPAVEDLGVEDAAILIRALGLLHKSKKQRAKEEKVLDLMVACFGNKPLDTFGNKDVEAVYEARLNGFVWPRRFAHRRPLQPNPKPIAIQKDWETFASVLNRLKKETDPVTRRPYLRHNRIAQLDLGSHAKAQRPSAHPHRYAWTFRYADESVERVREEGIDNSFFSFTTEGERRLHESRRNMDDVIPGVTRCMLVLQYGHGMRPGSWRHLKVEDIALDTLSVRQAIRGLRLADYDEKIPEPWARRWPHGAVVYRKEYLKGKKDRRYERIVPLSAAMKAELERYLEKREAWLRKLGRQSPWLFPNPTLPMKPIPENDARDLLYAAEALAREAAIRERGEEYAEEVLPDLDNTAWYAYRRAWKTLRTAFGWFGNKNANYVGGWSTKVGQISEVVYARLMPEYMLAVVEGLTVTEAVERYGNAREFQVAIDISPSELPPEPTEESMIA